MNTNVAVSIFQKIEKQFKSIKSPTYKHVDIADLQAWSIQLMDIKEYLVNESAYKNLINGISQAIAKKTKREGNVWRNKSERSINKTIPVVIKKKDKEIEFPYEWNDPNTGAKCYITDYWGAKNYMVMDVLANVCLFAEGTDNQPKKAEPIFEDFSKIEQREKELTISVDNPAALYLSPLDDDAIKNLVGRHKHIIVFTDKRFRQFTDKHLTSDEILKCLHDTSRIEFKLVYPVRFYNDKKKFHEIRYAMNVFSRLFELVYVDEYAGECVNLKNRKYYIIFNTILGEMFVHNLKMTNHDSIDTNFYRLPDSAQLLYRRHLLPFPNRTRELNLSTIKACLKLNDKNITNLKATIKENALKPLKEGGYIIDFSEAMGRDELKFIITKPSKGLCPDVKNSIPAQGW